MRRIVTLTPNPTVDETADVDRFDPGPKLRASRPVQQPGGGGLNVARVVHRLELDTLALWTCGGLLGQQLDQLLDDEGVPHRPLPVEGETRRSLTLHQRGTDRQLRFVFPGPDLSGRTEALLDALGEVDREDLLVMSGSLPPGLDAGFYAEAVRRFPPECRIVVDTHGPPLRKAIDAGVYLIKPNREELGELVDAELVTDHDVTEAARSLIAERPVDVVVVSLGSDGALVATDEGVTRIDAPAVSAVSAVGAGDSMVAGIAVGLARDEPVPQAVERGVAAGAAAVATPGTDLAHAADVERMLREVRGGR